MEVFNMKGKRVKLSKIVTSLVCLIPLAFTLTGSIHAQDTSASQWTAHIIESETRDQWVDQIAVAGDGTVWVTTRFDGMAYFDGVSWRTLHDVSEAMLPDLFFFGGFTAAQDGTVRLSDLYVLGRYADDAWTLYRSPDSFEEYGTYFMENTIQQYDAPVLVTEEALPLDRVTDLATDSNGVLWVATSEVLLGKL
jgi:ligand-binding sensor domain-containing protein